MDLKKSMQKELERRKDCIHLSLSDLEKKMIDKTRVLESIESKSNDIISKMANKYILASYMADGNESDKKEEIPENNKTNTIINMSLLERRKILSTFNTSGRIIISPATYAENRDSIRKSIESIPDDELMNGVFIRGVDTSYNSSESDIIVFKAASGDVDVHKKSYKNFPSWVTKGLSIAIEKKLLLPFVIQHHYRGHEMKEKEKEETGNKFKYNLKSVHSDFRIFIPDDMNEIKDNTVIKYESAKDIQGKCFGITINTPASVDKPDEWDNNVKHILCEGKLPQPTGWLYVEGVADIGEPGSSWRGDKSYAPGLLSIVSFGESLPTEANDHNIRLKLNCREGNRNIKPFEDAKKDGILIEKIFGDSLKNLQGEFAFTINHIGDKYLIFLNKVTGRKTKVSKEIMNAIFCMTESDCTRSDISKHTGLSKATVYNYQKWLGLI